MTQDNFSFQIDNKRYLTKEESVSVYLQDELRKLPESNWQNKKHKHRWNILTKEEYKSIIIWLMSNSEKLFPEIDENSNAIIKMIFDIHIIYIKYLNKANNID